MKVYNKSKYTISFEGRAARTEKEFKLEKALALMIAVSVLEMIAVIVCAVYVLFNGVSATGIAALCVLFAASAAALVVFLLLRRSLHLMSEQVSQSEDSIAALGELNGTLRAQRHDFLNHLQVVYSLIDLGKYDDANAYIEKVYGDIQKVSSVMRTSIPAVNAILHAKQLMCESRGITVDFDIRTTLSELPLEDWEFCRVLGNIIDNSIHALAETSREKRLRIEIFEDLRGFRFRISNTGPAIPPELWQRIFEEGFTTRPTGDGMGLAICRKLLSSCGGSLRVLSDDAETVFEGELPRRAELPTR